MEKKRRKFRQVFIVADSALRRKRTVAAVYILLRFLVILTMIAQFFNRDYESFFLCLLTLILLLLPTIVERALMVDLPNTLEIIIMLFIFAAEILGEIRSFYTTFYGWDTILHTINGFLCAAIGFALVDILNQSKKVSMKLSPLFVAIVAFCFSMTIGVVWEFFEFSMDQMFHLDMQKDTVIHQIHSVMLDPTRSNVAVHIRGINDAVVKGESLGIGGYLDIGLIDTMKDLIVNFIGAVVFSIIGYFYIKNRGKGRFAKRFIPRLKSKDADFLKKAVEEEEREEQALLSEKTSTDSKSS